ncbi:MAG: hypothetical protein ACI4CZ_10705 [Hominisplanchenecus sp.]
MKTAGSHSVSAYAVRSGYSASAPVSQTFSVGTAPLPSLSASEDKDGVTVTLKISNSSAQIKYSLGNNIWNVYTNPVHLIGTATVRYCGVQNGSVDSEVQTKTITVTKPSAPVLTIKNSSGSVAVRDFALLAWSTVPNAKEYQLNTYQDGVLKDTRTVLSGRYEAVLQSRSGYARTDHP